MKLAGQEKLARSVLAGVAVLVTSAGACGGRASGVRPGGGSGSAGSTGDTGLVGAVGGPVDTTVAIDTTARAQTMVGVGASLAFYVNWLTEHPSKDEIYDVIFRDLGLDVLRVGNWYQAGATDAPTIEVVTRAQQSLGQAPRLIMSSWSPPAAMKSNNDTKNGGTLVQQNGAYVYDQMGAWWASSLAAYATAGVHPDFVSLQNEPDFTAAWESCRLGATESATRAGYGPALAATAAALAAASSPGPPPQLIGPEVTGLAGNRLATYLAGLDPTLLGGIAHHLYTGGDSANTPDSYANSLNAAAAAAGGKPLFMTEYAPQSPAFFDTALLIHDALTLEGASAYLYWGLIWAPPDPTTGVNPGGLVTTENPFDRTTWTTAKGYIVNPTYYAVRHYARWIEPGFQRVGASSTVAGIRASAFVSPAGDTVTLVLLNADAAAHTVAVTTGDFGFAASALYRTSGTVERTAAIGPLGDGNAVTLPPMAAATIVLGPSSLIP